jgi:3-methyl-2-oxobutanoate hydroxymethyltransferase
MFRRAPLFPSEPPMTSVQDFARFKASRRRISMVAAYDAWSATLIARSQVDAILVGDSAAMVLHGHPTTLAATVEMMALHTAAVARLANDKLVIADLPFLSFRKGLVVAMNAVETLMRAGAHAVKLEGVDGNEEIVSHVVGSGVPVMGHIGLTPQSVHQLGGYRVQGRGDGEAEKLLRHAHVLQELGCFAIVLECIPASVAGRITSELRIPTIGIGAGSCTDGQVLVLHDLLGLGTGHTPKFVRKYLDGERVVTDALNHYDDDVKAGRFPAAEESYS